MLALAFAGLVPLSAGQNRLAELVAGGDPNAGFCRVEVIVDGVADIRMRADVATLLGLSGQPPQWRSFQCNGVMPANPLNFRFVRVEGPGRQDLIQRPRNGEAAVVHIENTGPRSSVYTFHVTWNYVFLSGPTTSGRD